MTEDALVEITALEVVHIVVCCLLEPFLDYMTPVGWISPRVTARVFSQLFVELDSHSAAHTPDLKVEEKHSAAHMLVFDCPAIESAECYLVGCTLLLVHENHVIG